MTQNRSWLQGPSVVDGPFDVDALRVRLQAMSGDELLAFGRQMHDLVYPLTYGPDGKRALRFRDTEGECLSFRAVGRAG